MRQTEPSTGVLALLLLALCACDSPSIAVDAATYAEVLSQAGQDPEAELERCARLGDHELRADCATVVATAAAKNSADPATWCARLPEGRWRDECTFQTAEVALDRSGAADAAALCKQSGRFEQDCIVHLWRPQLGALMEGMISADFATNYAAAEALYLRTSSSVGASAELESMYWFSFFGTGFRNSGRVEMSRCEGLPELGPKRCEAAAALLLTEPLEGLLVGAGQLASFCAASPPDSESVASLLGVSPSAALDLALASQQPMICGTGGVTLSGGLRTNPAMANPPTRGGSR